MDAVEQIKNFVQQEDKVKPAALTAIDYAIAKGIIMRTRAKSNSSEVVQHAPFTLFPSPVPKDLISEAIAVQKDFNFLMHAISQDYEFMKSSFKSVIETDEFSRNLFKIYEAVRLEKPKKAGLSIIRSDYMFHKPGEGNPSLKQIEVNMISSSFGAIASEKITSLHNYTLRKAGFGETATILPENHALTNIALGLVKAWEHYGNPSAVIGFMVTESETNIFDQRTLEFKIDELKPEVEIRRYTFQDVVSHGYLDDDDNLFVQDTEVAVVYFRAGYSPDHYPTEKEWDARLMLDKSNAVNCPSTAHQLVGAKKMQQILAQPKVLERFIKDTAAVKRIRDTFVDFYGLEMGSEGDVAIETVLQNPGGFVLKPQLEGGGNNLYNQDLVEKLNEVKGDNRRCGYIIMEKIHPMPVTTVILRAGTGPSQFKAVEGVSELGIFGILLAAGDQIMENSTAGRLLRTKPSYFDDGGVAAGVAVIDSPLPI